MNEKLSMYKHDFANHIQIVRGMIELGIQNELSNILKIWVMKVSTLRREQIQEYQK